MGIEGYEWCASIDLASFFDEIPHKLILKLIRRKIADERLVTLVTRALKAGIVIDGEHQPSYQIPAGIGYAVQRAEAMDHWQGYQLIE